MTFNKRKIRLILFSLVLFATYSSALGQTQASKSELKDFGKFYLLADTTIFITKANLPKKGQILLMLYDPYCDFCDTFLNKLHKEMDTYKDLQVYLISLSQQKEVEEFQKKHSKDIASRKNVHFLRDKDYGFLLTFDPDMFPSILLFDASRERLLARTDGIDDIASIFKALK